RHATRSLRLCFALLFSDCYGDHLVLHSSPTRRSSDLSALEPESAPDRPSVPARPAAPASPPRRLAAIASPPSAPSPPLPPAPSADRKSTRLNSSHVKISYAVFCLKKKKERS